MLPVNDSNFHDFLLNHLPLPIAIADSDIRVQAINIAAQNFLCVSSDEAHLRLCGEVLKCVHASQPGGCGGTPACKNCILRNSVYKALHGNITTRNKGNFHLFSNGEIKRLTFLVTTAPICYQNTRMVIILIEDISLVTELQGLLPICSVCHRIRDENNRWIPIESYIIKHSEVEFTHDYCPDCLKNSRE